MSDCYSDSTSASSRQRRNWRWRSTGQGGTIRQRSTTTPNQNHWPPPQPRHPLTEHWAILACTRSFRNRWNMTAAHLGNRTWPNSTSLPRLCCLARSAMGRLACREAYTGVFLRFNEWARDVHSSSSQAILFQANRYKRICFTKLTLRTTAMIIK